MSTKTFPSAVKEIIATGIAALFIFSLFASFEASAQPSIVNNHPANAVQTVEPSQQLAKSIALVMHLENDVITSKTLLDELEADFEANKISAQEIFVAALTYHQIQDALEQAKVKLVIELNHVANDKKLASFIAKK